MEPFNASTPEIFVAFAKALDEIKGVDKTKEADTGKYKYKYQTGDDIMDEVKRVCHLHGLRHTQIPSATETQLTVTTVLIDDDGETLTFAPMALPLPREAQALGSATTYLKRYSLVSIFQIATDDDDDGREATIAAQTQPGRRTEAERLIREQVAVLTDEQKAAFQYDFKAEFHSTLSSLDAKRHGQALTWTKEWVQAWVDPPESTEQQREEYLHERGEEGAR